jgi:hypothetical protein
MTQPVLSGLTLDAIQGEATRARYSGDRYSLLSRPAGSTGAGVGAGTRLALLTGELGNVARALTREATTPGDVDAARTELELTLLRVAAGAAMWVEALTAREAEGAQS